MLRSGSRGARVYGRTTTAMDGMSTPSPVAQPSFRVLSVALRPLPVQVLVGGDAATLDSGEHMHFKVGVTLRLVVSRCIKHDYFSFRRVSLIQDMFGLGCVGSTYVT